MKRFFARCVLALGLFAASASVVAALADSPPLCAAPAKGKLLVASRRITDPRFAESVILLVDHDDKGSLGLIINRRSDILLSKALPQVESLRDRDDKLFFGGPVSRREVLLLMQSSQPPPGAVQVLGSIYFVPGSSLLDGVVGKQVTSFRAYAGYAGWAPGQLEGELARGDWLVADADVQSIFSVAPSSIWPGLIIRLEGQWAVRAAFQPAC